MGAAIDVVLSDKSSPGTTMSATTVATGDSFTVRNFPENSMAALVQIIRRAAASGGVRVRSPLLHDNVRGIELFTNEAVSAFLLPAPSAQPLQSSDTLIVEVTGDTANHCQALLVNYYDNLPGASPRLYSWGDISGNVRNIKGLEVATTASSTIGAWADTVITTTSDLLHADRDYAILGYLTDAALSCVAVKGQDTNNLRVGGPGKTEADDTSNYFINLSQHLGKPCIPVINANNKANTFVSTADVAASTTANVTLIMAELAHNLG